MDSLERYLGDTYELVDTLKSSEQGFVAVVYDKRAKRLCTMKQRNLNSLPIYKTLKELNNSHVPQIYRLIERDGNLIVIEEHIDGQTLEEFFIYRQLDETLAEKILLQLCESLSILHERNIIHRDLKPSNIMLTEENVVKLIDFGIARFFKPESTADTELMGTRGYAPPEQFGLFDFGQTDRRSDIYALGMTMKTLLGEDYDGRFKKVLDKCIALEPAQRFQSVEELRRAVLSSKRPLKPWKVIAAAIVGAAIFFLPRTLEHHEPPQSEEKILLQLCESLSILHERNIIHRDLKPSNIMLTEENIVKLIDFGIAPGEVEMKLFLNGELTGKEHMVYLYGWQSWSRDEFGQFLFPSDWQARLRVENHSGKDLINPRIEVNIGDDEKNYDLPALANGQSFDLEIPLGNKLASPEKGSGHLQIILQAQGIPDKFLNKTFFLVK